MEKDKEKEHKYTLDRVTTWWPDTHQTNNSVMFVVIIATAAVTACVWFQTHQLGVEIKNLVQTLQNTQLSGHRQGNTEGVAEAALKVVNLLSDSCECRKDVKKSTCKGKGQVTRPSDCGELDRETCKSGIYRVYPDGTSGFDVYCNMDIDGGGWTVFQRRLNGNVNFYRTWETYKQGFGGLNGEFWLGNEHIHQLLSQGNYQLRVDLEDFEDNYRYAVYKKFSIENEQSGYKLDVGNYSGNAGDAMVSHNGLKFTTKDKDNDVWSENCAVAFKGAWWYGACHQSNLNGLYLKGKHESSADGMNWYEWKGHHYSLKKSTMMIRRI